MKNAKKEAVSTKAAPAAIGPYSQAIRSGELLFCSGQIGLDPASGNLAPGGVVAECRQAMKNLGEVLAAAGLGWGDLVRTTIYLTDLGDFTAVNEAYGSFLEPPYPARATVGVAALPKGARVEIDAVARV